MQNHGKPLDAQTGEVSGLLLLIILGLVSQGVSSYPRYSAKKWSFLGA